MCLACELDALWYAEWERLGRAGVPAAVSEGAGDAESAAAEDTGEMLASSAPFLGDEGDSPQAQTRGELTGGEAPAVPGVGEMPALQAASRSRFRCEETE